MICEEKRLWIIWWCTLHTRVLESMQHTRLQKSTYTARHMCFPFPQFLFIDIHICTTWKEYKKKNQCYNTTYWLLHNRSCLGTGIFSPVRITSSYTQIYTCFCQVARRKPTSDNQPTKCREGEKMKMVIGRVYTHRCMCIQFLFFFYFILWMVNCRFYENSLYCY